MERRSIFGLVGKILLALGIVFAGVAVWFYFLERKADYVEIYNDDGLFGEEYA